MTLAGALREKFPPARIVALAEDLVENSTDERVRMVALQFIADRAYGKLIPANDPANDIDGSETIDVSGVPLEERRAMLTTMTKMAALEPSDPADAIDVESEDVH